MLSNLSGKQQYFITNNKKKVPSEFSVLFSSNPIKCLTVNADN